MVISAMALDFCPRMSPHSRQLAGPSPRHRHIITRDLASTKTPSGVTPDDFPATNYWSRGAALFISSAARLVDWTQ
jgi:hypothetical protein